MKGKRIPAYACAFEDEASVAEGLKAFIKENPRMAGAFKVNIGADGQLEAESLHQAVSTRVIVRTTLD
jgi:hypothetical protein